MRGPIRSILLAALAVCGLVAALASQASAATLKETVSGTALQAVYGNPAFAAAVPIGGGLGRNFGFGTNAVFRASTPAEVGKNLKITVLGQTAEARDAYLGGTLQSNKTGANKPLGFRIESVDFQASQIGTTEVQSYADTYDRPWVATICPPSSATCKPDAQFEGPEATGGVKIENVSFDLANSIVVQGTVWGHWVQGTSSKPPCIVLKLPAAGTPTLVVTQDTANEAEVGKLITAIEGEACLISANNYYYKAGTVTKTPAIEIANE